VDAYDITATALTAQRMRLDTISSNLANVNTTRKPDGTLGAYKRRTVVFAPVEGDAKQDENAWGGPKSVSVGPDGKPMFQLAITKDARAPQGVQIVEIGEDTDTPMLKVFDPSHPDADKDGYVEMPNVNVVTEMVDMIAASRAYEANVTALQSVKSMNQATLNM
jgi:flagellar basal-body rod protein FlgC